MADKIVPRGPDSYGYWQTDDGAVGFAHRRLSIIDLSSEGHQPMVSHKDNLVITFNGEIYNFPEIRAKLTKDVPEISFRGHSDTEVMLTAIENWGLERALKMFNGMFAFALWDKKEKVLHLARDRIGEKPLYYGSVKNDFIFSSTLSSLSAYRGFEARVNSEALGLYLKNNYVPAPYSIFDGVRKLMPGHYATLSVKKNVVEVSEKSYWSLVDAYSVDEKEGDNGYESSVDELESLLKESVKKRMISDVPIGAFLSGGIDSSLIVAMMQSISDKRVKTFTIGFSEPEFNEAEHASKIARYLGTDHKELYISANDAIEVIPGMASIYDEPFADPSQIPTYLVSKLASEDVKVVLSGDGGDELFYGYNRYTKLERYWGNLNGYPAVVKVVLNKLIRVLPQPVLEMLVSTMNTVGIVDMFKRMHVSKIYELSDMLSCSGPYEIYQWMISQWKQPDEAILDYKQHENLLGDFSRWPEKRGLKEWMSYYDSMYYLPDDILVKLDRASMAVSLEGRIPLLDHNVIEFAASLPMRSKKNNGPGKRIVRDVLARYIPPDLYEKPKKGFAVPIDSWIKTDMREWAESLLDESLLKDQGYFNHKVIREKWNQHLTGKRNWHDQIWIILMFQNWLQHNNL